MSPQPTFPTADYGQWLTALKDLIRQSRVQAALAVNRELVLLYWRLGQEILQRQEQQGWGAKVVAQLAQDLRGEFPDMRGLSPRNLMYMRSFAEAWPEEAIVHQAGAQIPWKHNCLILDRLKDQKLRVWYIQKTIDSGWSRAALEYQIDTQLHLRLGLAKMAKITAPSTTTSTRCSAWVTASTVRWQRAFACGPRSNCGNTGARALRHGGGPCRGAIRAIQPGTCACGGCSGKRL